MTNDLLTVWQSLAWPGTVVNRLTTIDQAATAHGWATGRTDRGFPFVYEYTVGLRDWVVETATVTDQLRQRTLSLTHQAGQWRDANGANLPQLDGVSFIDLSITPFTNSLPLQRLTFKGHQPQTIEVVYFDENDFSLRRVQQTYHQTGPRTYRYDDVEQPSFTAQLAVDEHGLVVDYEHLFKRV